MTLPAKYQFKAQSAEGEAKAPAKKKAAKKEAATGEE